MKKLLYLLLITAMSIWSFSARAQCPGAQLDSACLTTLLSSGGGICAATLPAGMVHHYYDQDVSFVMPGSINITSPISSRVDLLDIQITGMSGSPSFPAGLNWSCDAITGTSCMYHPYAEHDYIGAIKFCGTPLSAGHYTITVYIHARVYVAAISSNQEQDQTYVTSFDVLPDTSAGAVNSFCDSGYYNFGTALGGTANPYTYNWNFGNGNTSTVQNPGIQTYPDTGNYTATMVVRAYQYRVKTVSCTALNSSRWSGDIEEAIANCGSFLPVKPDPYFKLPQFGLTSNTISDNCMPTWSGRNDTIPLGIDSLVLQVWDEDTRTPIIGSPDDSIVTVKFPVRYGTTAWSAGGSSGTIFLDTVVGLVVYDTIRFRINPLPTAGIIAAARDSFCVGDSVTLSVYNYGAYHYQWEKDSVAISGATDTFYTAKDAGIYSVVITDSTTGCFSNSNYKRVYTFSSVPTLAVNAVAPGLLANTNFPGAGYTIQWFKNGVLIPGANSVTLNHDGDGSYTCLVFNTAFPECAKTSVALVVSGLGTDLSNINSLDLFPNPNNGSFELKFNSFAKEDMEIRITDVVGRAIYIEKLNSFSGNYAKQIDLGSAQKGIYFVNIISGNKNLTRKVVVE